MRAHSVHSIYNTKCKRTPNTGYKSQTLTSPANGVWNSIRTSPAANNQMKICGGEGGGGVGVGVAYQWPLRNTRARITQNKVKNKSLKFRQNTTTTCRTSALLGVRLPFLLCRKKSLVRMPAVGTGSMAKKITHNRITYRVGQGIHFAPIKHPLGVVVTSRAVWTNQMPSEKMVNGDVTRPV